MKFSEFITERKSLLLVRLEDAIAKELKIRLM